MKLYEEHMTVCPKCEHWTILGPRYVSKKEISMGNIPVWSLEHMAWTCDRCGYVDKTECKDAAGDRNK